MRFDYIRLSVLCSLTLLLFSCGGKKESKTFDQLQDEYIQEPVLVVDDSDKSEVKELADRYMELLKSGNLDEAISMLSFLDSHDSIVPLPKSLVERQKNVLRQFPVLSYECESMAFNTATDNQIKYTIEFFEKAPDDPRPNTTAMYLKPVRQDGKWYLTVADSETSGNSDHFHN